MTDSCQSNALISLDEALAKIHTSISAVNGEETVCLHQALGRVVVEDCSAPFSLPAFPNSAMDGYAFNSADIKNAPFKLLQAGTSRAGHPFSGKLLSGQCIRIFTGAVIPSGADSVIMQEFVDHSDHVIHFPENTQAKQNVRYVGEDVKQHDCLLAAPKQLSAIDLGLLASAGIYEVKVKRKLRIAFFSTGDELRAIGSPLAAGQIYDSNRYSLTALLKNPCHEVTDLGVITDDKERIQQCLLTAAQNHDVIIST
ncbi:MAG: molybdopterin molybdotransferase MoeA, partial [Thiotrichaceae bacterium]|nr:molybdopterin molybdotransferase MoeA [Thiotrichaceae bacterium]